jgi:hypothetical protein
MSQIGYQELVQPCSILNKTHMGKMSFGTVPAIVSWLQTASILSEIWWQTSKLLTNANPKYGGACQ